MNMIRLATPEDTERLGASLARHLPDVPVVVFLEGDLGAGKTTTARALLHALGVEGAVRSPTYTLVERYETTQGEVAHLDLYRISDPEELEYLALDDLAARARLWLIEWPNRGRGMLPEPDLVVHLVVDGMGRQMRLEALSPTGQKWVNALRQEWPALASG